MRIALLIAALWLGGVASTQAQTFILRLVNHASQPVSSLNLFPLDADGDFIEDNLGGLDEDVAPGRKARAQIDADCGPMLAVVVLADGSDLRLNLDTCKSRTLLVEDGARMAPR